MPLTNDVIAAFNNLNQKIIQYLAKWNADIVDGKYRNKDVDFLNQSRIKINNAIQNRQNLSREDWDKFIKLVNSQSLQYGNLFKEELKKLQYAINHQTTARPKRPAQMETLIEVPTTLDIDFLKPGITAKQLMQLALKSGENLDVIMQSNYAKLFSKRDLAEIIIHYIARFGDERAAMSFGSKIDSFMRNSNYGLKDLVNDPEAYKVLGKVRMFASYTTAYHVPVHQQKNYIDDMKKRFKTEHLTPEDIAKIIFEHRKEMYGATKENLIDYIAQVNSLLKQLNLTVDILLQQYPKARLVLMKSSLFVNYARAVEAQEDYYKILNIEREANPQQIDDAIKKEIALAESNKDEVRKNIILEAGKVLKNPDLRKIYDDNYASAPINTIQR